MNVCQGIIENIKQKSNDQGIENKLYQLMYYTTMYLTSATEPKLREYSTGKYISLIEQIRCKITQQNQDSDGFESEEQIQIKAPRRPTAKEDSLIQALLSKVSQRDDLLRQYQRNKKLNCDSLIQLLTYSSPYQVWRTIADLKGSYYFFEVFECQRSDYDINYREIDRMMMCSKAYEREYQQYKAQVDRTLIQFQREVRKQVEQLCNLTYSAPQEPVCIILKDTEQAKCNCEQYAIKYMFHRWALISQFRRTQNKRQLKKLVCNTSLVDSLRSSFNQQFQSVQIQSNKLKSHNAELRVHVTALESKMDQLKQANKTLQEEVIQLKYQLQNIMLKQANQAITIQQYQQFIQVATEMNNGNENIAEFKRILYVGNNKKIIRENVEAMEKTLIVNDNVFNMSKQQQIGCQTDYHYDIPINVNSNTHNHNKSIVQFKSQTLQFNSDDSDLEVQINNVNYNHQSTQTDIPKQLNINNNRKYVQQSPQRFKLSQPVSKSPTRVGSVRQPERPVFSRLFNDSAQQQQRKVELTQKIQDVEKLHWEEVLSLMNLLSCSEINEDVRDRIEKSMAFYKDHLDNRNNIKMPQVKPKQREKVSEYFIDGLFQTIKQKKKVALNQLVVEFNKILKVNRINRSVDISLQYTL